MASRFEFQDTMEPPNGSWPEVDCIAPMAETKTWDYNGRILDEVDFDFTCWPHNTERLIPFKHLTDTFPNYVPKGQHVFLIDGFLATFPSDATHENWRCISWDELVHYNCNVFGAWRLGDNGSYYIDTQVNHFPYCPLGLPPDGSEGHVVFRKNGILRTANECYVKDVLKIRDYRDVDAFRYSQYNKNAIGDWSAMIDGSGYYVDVEKRNELYLGRELH